MFTYAKSYSDVLGATKMVEEKIRSNTIEGKKIL